ncbi:MAG: response regulator [Pseudobdellovibrionaceae bacterium]
MEASQKKSKVLKTKNKTPKTISARQSILSIDDNLEILDLQRIILELEGFEVFTAESGMEALEILSEIDEPNLILLDMQLGDMNGTQFLAMLEEKKPEIIEIVPIVFMTGMDVVPESKAAGLIRKPANMDTFIKAVQRFIEMGYHEPYKH